MAIKMNRYQAAKQIKHLGMIKGVLISLLGILYILCTFLVTQAAESTNINISVKYGFDQHAKYGRYLPVHVDITNDGEEFSGYVQAYASKAGGNVAYEKEVTVNKQETLGVSFTIPVVDNSGYLNVVIRNKKGEAVLQRQYILNFGNYDKSMYVGVLSENSTALEYLTLYGSKVFWLEESMIPTDSLGLDLLDVLVINQFHTDKLNQNQLTAINEWVSAGGTLVLGTGEYQGEVLQGFGKEFNITALNHNQSTNFSYGTDENGLKELKSKIQDYEESKRIFIENLKSQNQMLESYGLNTIHTNELEQNLWTKERFDQLKVEDLTKEVVDLEIGEGICVKKINETTLLSIKNHGLGRIEIFHFDLSLSKEYEATGLSILTAIRTNISDVKKSQLDNELYGAYMDSGMANYIRQLSNQAKPSILNYALVLSIYIILLGPILYFVLKKIDKSNWYFKMIPILSLIFMIAIYLMGGDTRIDKPFMEYVQVSEYEEGDTLKNKMYLSITGNNNRDFRVSLSDDYNVRELSQNTPYIYEYQILKNLDALSYKSSILYKDGETDIKLTGLPAFSPVSFQLTRQESGKNLISSNLSNISNGLEGVVANHFDFGIDHAILLSGGYVVGVGSIEANQEVDLEGKYSMFLNVRDELYQEEVIKNLIQPEELLSKAESDRITGMIESLMEEEIGKLDMGSYLVGVKVDKENDLETGNTLADNIEKDFEKSYDVYSTKVVKIPIEVNYTKGTQTFMPSIDPYLVSNDSFYNKYYQARYLNSPEVTLTYHFPESEKISKFSYLRNQNGENVSEYLSKFTGTIEFLNIKTGAYDQVFLSGYDQNIYNAEDYLTDENVLTVKYSTNMSLKSFNIILPHISYWKEE